MNTKLYQSIHEMANGYNPPHSLKEQVMKKVGERKGSMNMKVLMSIAIIALTIPLFAFVKQYFYADQLYGSFSSLTQKSVSMTLDDYSRLDDKLSFAYEELGEGSAKTFMKGVADVIQFKLKFGDKKGNINQFSLTPEAYEHYFKLVATVQPYFDKLNGYKPSNEVLNEQDYIAYVKAIILLGSIITESNEGYEDYSYTRILPELQEQYDQASSFISKVESVIR